MPKKKTKKKKKAKKRKAKRRSTMPSLSSVDYKVESAADTLMAASAIDANPTLKRKAKALLKRRQALIGKTINGR